MNIAVNTRLLLKNKLEGIGWYTFETLKRITKNHPEHHFFFLFDRPHDPQFIFSDNITPVEIFPPSRHAFLWYIWFEWQLPKVLKKIQADIFVSPDGYLSTRSKIPAIPVIHDVNFVHRPEDIPFWANHYYNFYFPKYARIARRIVTVSNYSKYDIATSFGVSPDKIDVSHNGVNEIFKPVSINTKEKLKEEYTDGNDFFVFVGAMHPRKNVAGLLKAFDLFKNKSNSDIRLLIVGEKMFKTKPIEHVFESLKHKNDIIFVGRLSPEKLNEVVASALALTFVPFFEGFGIPILEAMRCGTPVICSSTTSMPEVAGDAALIVNPGNAFEIAQAMLRIHDASALRNQLSEKGLERSHQFSWDKTAKLLWESIEKVLYEHA